MFRLLSAAVLLIAIFAESPAARAEDAEAKVKRDEFVGRLFASPLKKNDKTYACFVRVYDAQHLARHPQQKVNNMKLLVTADSAVEAGAQATYSFRLGLKYRNRKGAFDSSGECRHAGVEENSDVQLPSLGCSVDCDGGGIRIDMSKDNRAAIVRVDRVRIWQNNKPDDEDFHSLDAGQDDHIFRLERASNRECASLVTDREELAAMRTKK